MTPTAQPTHIPAPTETYPGPYQQHDFGGLRDIGSFGGESIAFFHDGTLYEARPNPERTNIIIESFADPLDVDSAATVVADLTVGDDLYLDPDPYAVVVDGTTLTMVTSEPRQPPEEGVGGFYRLTAFPSNPAYDEGSGFNSTLINGYTQDGSRYIGYYLTDLTNVILVSWPLDDSVNIIGDPIIVSPFHGTIYGRIEGLNNASGMMIFDGSQIIIGVVEGNLTRFYSINDLNNPQAQLIHTADRAYRSMSYDPTNNRIYLTGRSGFLGRRTVYVTNAP